MKDLVTLPNTLFQSLKQFYAGLGDADRLILYGLIAASLVLGFAIGRRRTVRPQGNRSFGAWRFPKFQNRGEALVSHVLRARFNSPDYHLMNHVTIQMDDGTTQVDHILVSRYGVFVIETKDFSGWIFANAADRTWTQVHFRLRHKFQNPIRQNYKHVLAVRGLLDFLPPELIKSVVIFSGDAVFKTEKPPGVFSLDEFVVYMEQETEPVLSRNHLQYCVGRIETVRLLMSGQTDVDHVQNLARRFGGNAE